MKDLNIIKSCRSCDNKDIKKFFNLGEQPISEAYLESPDSVEDFFPLSLGWCRNCSLVQLNETINPERLFSYHPWVTGTSEMARSYARVFKQELIKRDTAFNKGHVLEIASNDGTFLKPFIDDGYEVLGVDPAHNVVEIAEKAGIPTSEVFWGNKEAQRLVDTNGTSQIVFARNVLPHVAEPHDFISGVATVLASNGVFAVEVHYAGEILKGLHYDSIYHAHLCYFTLQSLEYLLNQHGLFVFDISESPISGGSIVVYASKGKRPESQKVNNYRKKEKDNKMNDLNSWQSFARDAEEHKRKLLKLVMTARSSGGKICAYGASARSSTLMNFCDITSDTILAIADKNSAKQNLYTPGTHIPILPPEKVLDMKPDYLFMSAWNFFDEIKEYVENELGYSGDYIVPLPNDPQIIQS